MSIALYDKAMLGKIKSWFSNTIYANTAITYNMVYDLLDIESNKANMKFPLINIYRVPGFDLSDTQTFAARKQGIYLGDYGGGEKDLMLSGRYLALDITYQLDFYHKTSEGLYDLIIQVMQALNQYPIIEVEHKDNKTGKTFVERYELTYNGGPLEQSEFQENDRVYRAYIQYDLTKVRVYDITDYTRIVDSEVGLGIQDDIDNILHQINLNTLDIETIDE